MRGSLFKGLTIAMLVIGLAGAALCLNRLWNVYEEVQAAAHPILEKVSPHEETAAHAAPHSSGSGHGEKAAAAGHAAQADSHGGASASGHGGGGHGESSGHGSGPSAHREPANKPAVASLVSIEEVVANINATQSERGHLLGIKLELELFEDGARGILEQHQAGIRNTVLLTTMEQSYESLSSIGGKLYYKELLVSRLNEFFKQPLVRDVHFSSFYLQ